MSDPIAKYVVELRRRGAKAAALLQAGAPHPAELVKSSLPHLQFSDDLAALWWCFNGTKHSDGTLGEMWLDGAFYFLSEQEALADYREMQELWLSDPEARDYWPEGFFPIATSGDGSRLLLNAISGSPTNGAVYELFFGEGVVKVATSIKDYFDAALAWMDSGAVSIDGAGLVTRDFAEASRVAAVRLPACDGWNDALPPAYETKDWLP